ncbi:MAG: hypothetical protein E3J94_07150 [Desulfobacteraceae bacterium]|nr:MAG: hypothetical protein E3J94_07150 [Desulfobacteraceae bacterium]
MSEKKAIVLEWEQSCLVEIELPREARRSVKGIVEVFNKYFAPALAAINNEYTKRFNVNNKIILTRQMQLKVIDKQEGNGSQSKIVFVLIQPLGVMDEKKTAELWKKKGWTSHV